MSKKICLQAGHKGLTTGATGAPGERAWNTKVVPMVASRLRKLGYEVYETNSLADQDEKVTGTDWDLFLAVHYDADIYNDRGGFIDTPDPSVDEANEESKRIAEAMRSVYFPSTGIPEKPKRSNANTRFYYIWSSLSASTPCVLIECGVGNRKPEDYNTLFDKIDLVADALTGGIHKAFDTTPAKDWRKLYEELAEYIRGLLTLSPDSSDNQKIMTALQQLKKDFDMSKEVIDSQNKAYEQEKLVWESTKDGLDKQILALNTDKVGYQKDIKALNDKLEEMNNGSGWHFIALGLEKLLKRGEDK